MKLKPIITEVIILIAIYLATRLFVPFLAGSWEGNASLDINLHDTYFVIDWSVIIIPVFLMLTTIIYLVKESFYCYKRRLQNLILIIANFLFLLIIYPLSALLNMIPKPDWTIYPPLSALPNGVISTADKGENILYFIKQITPALIIIFMLILVITAILTGKNWNLNKNEQSPA
ncbi:hypothetical protein G7092_22350 [Mucilaginibacter sp. HC2]|uniref:hypothetical protein n=1 Tax=Mucilaginibacter inviolabilis TaxID=2714892 RepID=UPI00140D4507|nr:hypothetical protein [Mucilaginibacter inviolabilis]NHA06567.1 hypothetical protein [Mucilaginibacter inviolabilis]